MTEDESLNTGLICLNVRQGASTRRVAEYDRKRESMCLLVPNFRLMVIPYGSCEAAIHQDRPHLADK